LIVGSKNIIPYPAKANLTISSIKDSQALQPKKHYATKIIGRRVFFN